MKPIGALMIALLVASCAGFGIDSVDLQLTLEAGFMKALATGNRVATAVRNDLDIPDAFR